METFKKEINSFLVVFKKKEMHKGVITRTFDRGFGFIRCEELGKDIFFHSSACVLGLLFDNVRPGEKVKFNVKNSPKGLIAVGVEKDLEDYL